MTVLCGLLEMLLPFCTAMNKSSVFFAQLNDNNHSALSEALIGFFATEVHMTGFSAHLHGILQVFLDQ